MDICGDSRIRINKDCFSVTYDLRSRFQSMCSIYIIRALNLCDVIIIIIIMMMMMIIMQHKIKMAVRISLQTVVKYDETMIKCDENMMKL